MVDIERSALVLDNLLCAKLFTFAELLELSPKDFPQSGVYGWFFDKNAFQAVPHAGARIKEGKYLFYIGIGPSSANSTQNLYNRLIKNHCKGRARSSTLRYSIGSILLSSLKIESREKNKRIWFSPQSENNLNKWLKDHAFIAWIDVTEPWNYEKEIIALSKPPLNIEHNNIHPYCDTLLQVRKNAKHINGL